MSSSFVKTLMLLGVVAVSLNYNFKLAKKCEYLEQTLLSKQLFFEKSNHLSAKYTVKLSEEIATGLTSVLRAKEMSQSSEENRNWYSTNLPTDVVQLLSARVSD